MDTWSKKSLCEICNIELGKTPARKNAKYWDEKKKSNNIWLSIADLLNTHNNFVLDSKEHISNEGAKICKLVKEGTLLASFKLTLGRLAFAGKDLYTNEAIAALEIIDKSIIDRKYLYWYLTFFDWDKAVGSDIKIKGKTLNKKKLKILPVLIPPLEEQKQIVEILDKAFERIAIAEANTKKNLANAIELFDSYIHQVLRQHQQYSENKTLKEISFEFGRGKSKHRPRGDKKLYGGKYPLIQTGDVANSDHYITNYSQTYNEIGLAQSKLWKRGTICIAIVGANVAETGILNFDACFPDSVIGIVVNPQIADSSYLEYMLQSYKSELKKKGKGTARDNINMATFANQNFPFPDLEIQQKIAAQIEQIADESKNLEKIYQRKLEALVELKQSILQKAFTGQLTSPPL